MSELKVTWNAEEELRRREVVATGQAAACERQTMIEMGEMTAEQRAIIAPHMHVLGNGKCELSLGFLSAVPDSALVVQLCVERNAEAERQKAEDAEHAARAAEEARVKAEHERELDQQYVEVRPQIERLIADKDLHGLAQFSWPAGCDPDHEMVAVDAHGCRTRNISLHTLHSDAFKTLRDERAEAGRAVWIEAHGSAYLKRAVAGGYNCQRQYVIERAALEAPGFTVDINNAARWKSRSCPSERALDAQDEASKLALGDPYIVWLTAFPEDRISAQDGEEYEYDESSPCEAVVISAYLGKYDLVHVV